MTFHPNSLWAWRVTFNGRFGVFRKRRYRDLRYSLNWELIPRHKQDLNTKVMVLGDHPAEEFTSRARLRGLHVVPAQDLSVLLGLAENGSERLSACRALLSEPTLLNLQRIYSRLYMAAQREPVLQAYVADALATWPERLASYLAPSANSQAGFILCRDATQHLNWPPGVCNMAYRRDLSSIPTDRGGVKTLVVQGLRPETGPAHIQTIEAIFGRSWPNLRHIYLGGGTYPRVVKELRASPYLPKLESIESTLFHQHDGMSSSRRESWDQWIENGWELSWMKNDAHLTT